MVQSWCRDLVLELKFVEGVLLEPDAVRVFASEASWYWNSRSERPGGLEDIKIGSWPGLLRQLCWKRLVPSMRIKIFSTTHLLLFSLEFWP